MGRKPIIVVLLGAVLATTVVFAGTASAATYTAEGPVPPGGVVTVHCPAGEIFVSGTVNYWGTPKGTGKQVGTGTMTGTGLNEAGQPTGGETQAPPKARYYRATYTCEPPPSPTFQTISQSGTFDATGTARVDCPAEHPYLWSVLQMDVLDPAGGPPIANGYAVTYDQAGNPTGVEFRGAPFWGWQVSLTCTDTWPQPAS